MVQVMKQYNLYSKITNKVFYIKKEDGTYTEQGSLLKEINDNKLILILHELFIGRDLRDIYRNTIDGLLEDIGYKQDKDNRKSAKDVLLKLRELKLIDFNGEDKDIKSSTLLKIDISNLKDDVVDNYVELSEEVELNIIKKLDINIQKKTGLLKLFLYLKARQYKDNCVDSETSNCEREKYGRAEATYQSYEWISKYTGLGMKQISEYIKILQELNLITVDNCGYKYKDGQKDIISCENIFMINTIQDMSRIKYNMEIAKEQYKNDMRKKGWHISSKK